MASLNLSSAPSVLTASRSEQGALCTVTIGGTTVYSKVLHPSPTNKLILDLPGIVSSYFNPPYAVTTSSYSVSYNGSVIDSGTFKFAFV